MDGNSIISLHLHSYTLLASYTAATMRLSLEPNNNDHILFQSDKFKEDNFPTELRVLFENVAGFY
jgi:hypothetical protein